MGRPVKREPPTANTNPVGKDRQPRAAANRERPSQNRVVGPGLHEPTQTERRVLRSKYLALHNKIKDERDDLTRIDSKKFDSILKEVEDLHQLVQKPREQVADAEAFLDITNTLVTSVKSQSNEGITAADFVSSFLKKFGESRSLEETEENAPVSIKWKDFGLVVSPFFAKCYGLNTMMGPMNTELKQRKAVVQRRRTTRQTEKLKPEEVKDTGVEEKTDTDKNMHTMFGILRKERKNFRLESLILDRRSFAQTVENLFALSFLVKDGRAEITVDETGSHFVLARNAPYANSVMSGEASYKHFVFRFDYKDWKLMMDRVPEGEELMPHRGNTAASQVDREYYNTQESLPRTPIRKLSRNRGLVIREETVVEDSPEIEDVATEATGIRRCKRKLI